MERTHDVHVEGQPEGLVRQLREHRGRRDTRVVDEDVQRTPAQPGGLFGRGIGGGAVTDVQRARVGLAACGANPFGHCGSRVCVDVGDEHRGTRFGQRGRDGGADTAARTSAGDQRRATGQIEVAHQ